MVHASAVFSTVFCCALMHLIAVLALVLGMFFVCLSISTFCDGLPLVFVLSFFVCAVDSFLADLDFAVLSSAWMLEIF